jgi:hypothetical protein
MPENGLVPIGELARRTGVATSALRYYERIGLLSPAERAGQRRHYPPATAERVALIRLYQDAGFTLTEMVQTRAEGPGIVVQAKFELDDDVSPAAPVDRSSPNRSPDPSTCHPRSLPRNRRPAAG